MMRHYCELSRSELELTRSQFTKWTADVLTEANLLVLNCQDLGEEVFIGSASYFCENWPAFDMSITLNGLECQMGHRHGLLAASGGIYAVHDHGWKTLDYLSPRAEIRLFVNGSPKDFTSGLELKEKFGNLEKINLWISDPRLQFVAYAILLEDPALFRPLIDPLPKMEDAIMFLRHYDLYKPRLNFSLNYFGHDPYAQLHWVHDGLAQHGRRLFNVLKEGE